MIHFDASTSEDHPLKIEENKMVDGFFIHYDLWMQFYHLLLF